MERDPTRTPCRLIRAAPALSAALAGCGGHQSALLPTGPAAQSIASAWWVMFWGSAAVLILVVGLALLALVRRPGPSRLGHPRMIVAGGVVFPVLALSGLLVYGFGTGHDFKAAPSSGPAALSLEVIGRRWWWEVRYTDPRGPEVVSANEIHIPVGVPVDIAVSTADVIHSFWVPSLAGKIDMIPGKVNRIRIRADRPGVYRGQCAEYCGIQHTLMGFHVVVHPEGEFEAWFANERSASRPPRNPFLEQGREVFMDSGCGACHTIRGTEAAGTLGPDLTHVGGRRSLAAATLDNHRGTLAGWIADSQTVKPGNLMPSFDTLEGPQLRAAAAYLESLK